MQFSSGLTRGRFIPDQGYRYILQGIVGRMIRLIEPYVGRVELYTVKTLASWWSNTSLAHVEAASAVSGESERDKREITHIAKFVGKAVSHEERYATLTVHLALSTSAFGWLPEASPSCCALGAFPIACSLKLVSIASRRR
jgi:hypothetical protein